MFSETHPLQPIRLAHQFHVVDDAQVDQLASGTLEILEEVGVHCPSEQCLWIYATHGAQGEFENQIVRLPPNLVIFYLSKAPRRYTMGARSPLHDINLDGTAMYRATDGCGIETIDFTRRERRASSKKDVARMARITDYLKSISFYWPIVSATDYPSMAPLHELDAASSLMLCALAGAETRSGLGLLESWTLLYPESVILDSDICHCVRIEAVGPDTSHEAMALDVIRDVGPRGPFLNHRHTREKLKESAYSGLTAQVDRSGLLRDPLEVARQEVELSLKHHDLQPLEAAQRTELTRILAAADREMGGIL